MEDQADHAVEVACQEAFVNQVVEISTTRTLARQNQYSFSRVLAIFCPSCLVLRVALSHHVYPSGRAYLVDHASRVGHAFHETLGYHEDREYLEEVLDRDRV